MLEKIGINSVEELFSSIPEPIKLKKPLDLPEPLSELEVYRFLSDVSKKNTSLDNVVSFLGGGYYDHFIPAVVDYLASRGEFYTAYTPYEPEASQGTLEATFEYQTLICELTGMDISNASHYDGATATAEAVIMSLHKTKRKIVVISQTVNPITRDVIKTYLQNLDVKIFELPYCEGAISLREFNKLHLEDVSCVVTQNPNFFGIVEDLSEIFSLAKQKGVVSIVSVDIISLALLKPPSEYGADIVTGEGQPLGIELYFGGPGLGIMAAKNEFLRLMPGRIVGETTNKNGKRGFVLTIQSREQHIRREKATSNICSNEALMALRATIYLCALGKNGLAEVAKICLQKSHYLADKLTEFQNVKLPFTSPFFREFVVRFPKDVKEINKNLLKKGFFGGIDVGNFYPELKNHVLICATEKITKKNIDDFVDALSNIL